MSGGAPAAPRWRTRRFWIAVGIVAGVALVAIGILASLRKDTVELPVYVTGAQRIAAREEIYRSTDAKPFTYPPFFALPFLPFVPLSADWQRAMFFVVNLASLGAILWLIERVARPVLRSGRAETGRSLAFFWVPTLLISGRHVSAVFENQSHDLLVFLLIMLGVAAVARLREAVGGVCIGLAAACKATPLLFLPVLAAQRRVRATLAMSFAAVGATLLPDVLFPRTDGRLWVVAWADRFLGAVTPGAPAEGAAWLAHSVLNQNLAGAIFRLSTPVPAGTTSPFAVEVAVWNPGPGVVKAITIAAQLLIVALIAWAAWPGRSRGLSKIELGWRRVGEAGAVVCGMVLLSPMSSKAHFCVLLLPIAFCVAEHFFRRRSLPAIVCLTIALVMGLASMKGLVGGELGNEMLAFGAVAWTAFAVLLASVAVLVRRPVPITASVAVAPGPAPAAAP